MLVGAAGLVAAQVLDVVMCVSVLSNNFPLSVLYVCAAFQMCYTIWCSLEVYMCLSFVNLRLSAQRGAKPMLLSESVTTYRP